MKFAAAAQTPAPQDMRQSVMFRNNEDRVTKLFTANRKTKHETVALHEDPRKIKLDMKNAYKNSSN